MKNRECRRKSYVLPLFLSLLAAVFVLGACTTPEKAKANHVARGQALLKEKKFQEAALEFRNALQIDVGFASSIGPSVLRPACSASNTFAGIPDRFSASPSKDDEVASPVAKSAAISSSCG